MAEPFARDEDRRPDVEAEGVVFERGPVAVAHQEPDEAGVGVVHLLLPAREADACAVDDREVARHRSVEPDEAVIEDVDRLLGYHFSHGRHAGECNGGICRCLRLLLPHLAGRFLPGRRQAGRVPRALRGGAPVGRAEQLVLPPPVGGPVRELGAADAARVPLRGQDEPPDHALRPARPDPDVPRARADPRRPPRPRANPASGEPAAR